MFSQRQLGWNCFDIAVGITREDLVRYALENSKSLELRQLLAPEIRHAAALAAIEMNATETNNRPLISLLGLPSQSPTKEKTCLKKAETPQGLPASMRTRELQTLLNNYADAFEQLRPFVSACNDALFLKDGGRLSIEGLDELPQKELIKHGFFSHFEAYQAYQKAREQFLTPIEQRLMEYSQSEETYRQYIQDYYGAKEWVAFNRQFSGEHATSMVDIAARLLNAILVIVQPSEEKLKVIYRTSNFSPKTLTIVFNGTNHFWSYSEYQRMRTVSTVTAESSFNKEVDDITRQLGSVKLAKTLLAEDLIKEIERLIKDFNHLFESKTKTSYAQLKTRFDNIMFYLNKPGLVLKASYQSGLQGIKEKFGAILFRINLYLNKSKLLSLNEARKAHRGFSLLAKLYKEKRAYTDILRGKKFIKAGLGVFNENKPLGQPNPIAAQSKKNIRNLIAELRAGNYGARNKFGLSADEAELFKLLLNLPLRMQHATNFYYPALNAGALDSYTEIRRRNPDYHSPFSTNGNIEKLSNGGFTFFRIYVDPINSQDTRYGKTTLVFDINLLRTAGWISLHDQLKPFPSKNTWRFYWDKRLLRTSEEAELQTSTKDKSLLDGNRYRYRTDLISSYDKGKLDTQKSFGTTITTTEVTRSFLEEIFFGEDILIGIALSVIRELRFLEQCGFRQGFLALLNQSRDEEKVKLLGKLIKELFRIEGKYPVSLRLQANFSENTQRVSEYVNTQGKIIKQKFEVINPDGDGRYHVDGSVNTEAHEFAQLSDRKKFIEDRLHVTRSQAARVTEGSPQKLRWVQETEELEEELEEIQQKQLEDQETRRTVIQYFIDLFEVDYDRFAKIDTQKLNLLRENFDFVLEAPAADIDEILTVSAQQLSMFIEDPFYEILENGWVSFSELTECTLQQLEHLSEYNIKKPIEERDMTISELLRLYDEDPMHLVCLTCDDLTDYVLENAPDIHPIVLQYAQEEDVDFDWILEELGESDRALFRANLGLDDDFEEIDDCSQMSDPFGTEEDDNNFSGHDDEDSYEEDFPSNDNDDSRSEDFSSQFSSLSLLSEKSKEGIVEQTAGNAVFSLFHQFRTVTPPPLIEQKASITKKEIKNNSHLFS